MAFISPPVGSNSTALAGILPGFSFLGSNQKVTGCMYLIGAGFWGISFAACAILWVSMYRLYRHKGHTVASASAAVRSEATGTAALLAASRL